VGGRQALPPPSAAAATPLQPLAPAPPQPKAAPPAERTPPTPPPLRKISLDAADAKLSGECRFEAGADKHCIGYWSGQDATATWEFVIERPGAFAVEVVFSADAGSAGNEFTVAIGERQVRGTVRSTGGWNTFESMRIGILNITLPSAYTLRVRPARKPPGQPLMNLRAVNLIPVRD